MCIRYSHITFLAPPTNTFASTYFVDSPQKAPRLDVRILLPQWRRHLAPRVLAKAQGCCQRWCHPRSPSFYHWPGWDLSASQTPGIAGGEFSSALLFRSISPVFSHQCSSLVCTSSKQTSTASYSDHLILDLDDRLLHLLMVVSRHSPGR